MAPSPVVNLKSAMGALDVLRGHQIILYDVRIKDLELWAHKLEKLWIKWPWTQSLVCQFQRYPLTILTVKATTTLDSFPLHLAIILAVLVVTHTFWNLNWLNWLVNQCGQFC